MAETVPTGGSGAPPDDVYVVDSPYGVARWRPLVHWAMHIPHHIVIQVLNLATGVVFVIYWLSLLATGRLDRSMYSFLVMVTRYEARAVGFLLGFSERYPPFDFDTGPGDNGVYPPVRLDVPAPPETTPRRAALNCVLAVPHYFAIVVYGLVAAVIMIIGWFAVLFTGAWPTRSRDYLVKLGNYYMRVWLYVTMVETRYPRFGT
jgi:hypothetical protein